MEHSHIIGKGGANVKKGKCPVYHSIMFIIKLCTDDNEVTINSLELGVNSSCISLVMCNDINWS